MPTSLPNRNLGLVSGLRKLYCDESGQDLIEYALVAALLALGAVASMKTVGQKIAASFTGIATSLNSSI